MNRERLKKFWCGKNIEKSVEFFNFNFKLQKNELINQADLICNNTFIFRDHWEMERTNKPVAFMEKVQWDSIPFEDPEWTYALNRHSCFLNLAKAWNCFKDKATKNNDIYSIPQDTQKKAKDKKNLLSYLTLVPLETVYTKYKYAEKFMELAKDWMSNVPLNEDSKKLTWRSIEAGIRCENWLKAMLLFSDCKKIPESFWDEFERVLYLHGEYLMSVNEAFHKLSNWGILQNHGLLLVGIYFDNKDWINEAIQRLEDELSLQIFEDGTQWEQSPMYHCEVLHCCLSSIEHMKRFGIKIPELILVKVKKMLYALGMWSKPNGHIPCQSDSDDIDAGDLLVHGACFFSDGILKFLSDIRFRAENIWDLGIENYAVYELIEVLMPKESSYALKDSGNYMLRSSFGKKADYLRFHCGCIGSGHGHGDLLHIDLFSNGEDILIDSGRYTYMNTKIRKDFKSPSFHNTICVDDEDFCKYTDSWMYEKTALPVKGEYRFTKTVDFVSGAHLGYIEKGIYICRKIIFIKPDLYIIMDECYGNGRHKYSQNWHFSGNGKLILNDKKAVYMGENAYVKCIFLHGQGALSKKEYSTEYNSLKPCHCINVNLEQTGYTSMITLISTMKMGEKHDVIIEKVSVSLAGSGGCLLDKEAEAVRIIKNSKEYVAVFCHEEVVRGVNLIQACGYHSYGRVLLFSKENPKGICLQY